MSGRPELLNPEGLRLDGRRPNELRVISSKLGQHSVADGSAFLEMGQTRVMCLVFGPHEVSTDAASLNGNSHEWLD